MYLRRIFRLTLRAIGASILLVIIYFITAFSLSYISVNSDVTQSEKDTIEIYILTNGIHTDLVLPFKNEYKDWSRSVNPTGTKSGDTSANYVGFGWGDKQFYLETPTWSDLKFTTAFNALFYLSSSAMHVTFYDKLKETPSCKRICISKESYFKLVNYIDKSFDADSLGNYTQIKGASYWNNDSFYEAKGTFSFLFTCNTWANKGLKTANLKACLWTPFDNGIFYQYSK